ncbi:MAG TPA: photosynthetic reaction center cytochrome c subunit family protein [Vicinamibacterales bacterium]|nr:photosynthetic reaction center cytochrome c subunit family protein [Vicinamibacterales bacterium]
MGRIVLCLLLGAGVTWAQVTSAPDGDHATSRSINRALGVECTHCHVASGSAEPERPALAVARRMVAMVEELNTRGLAAVSGRISCWTCHAGQVVPSRLPREAWEKVLAAWPAGSPPASDGVKLTMSVYTASVGRTCAGCHESGGTGRATEEAEALVNVMTSLFPVMEKYLPAQARTQCFMCHKGRPHPLIAPGQ